ncbi:MAB_1171c family putative transporter [Streptomyces rimosus]|uniref:MAB_1171c family putative transporter n=1 Tax=Streptomyces rimosus TaxID=1927 RepID=UPI00067C7749|nr:MAB_1171c family putative transporter [Streptomyces rimosus]
MTGQSIAAWIIAALVWAAALYQVRALFRHPGNPARWTVCTALFLAGAAVSCSAPATITYLNHLSGVPNLGTLVLYVLLVAVGASARLMLAYWHSPTEPAGRSAWRWAAAYALLIPLMCVLFALGDTPTERLADFDTYYATVPPIATCIVLYLLALAAMAASVAVTCWRWATVAGRPWLRRGLRVLTASAACELAFCAARLTAVAARWPGANWDALNTKAAPVFAFAAPALAAIGVALPACGQVLTRLWDRWHRYRAYRQLHPLWDALRRATPQIVLSTRPPWWDIDLRLTRRLAEINDGRLALRSYTDTRITEAAWREGHRYGLKDDELAAVVEAARLKTAAAAKTSGTRPASPLSAASEARGGADGASELAWLCRIAHAFVHSPVVSRAQQLANTGPSSEGARTT